MGGNGFGHGPPGQQVGPSHNMQQHGVPGGFHPARNNFPPQQQGCPTGMIFLL